MASSTTTMTSEALRTLLEGPAMSPPAGMSPNFQNPPNLAVFTNLTLALGFTFGTLAVLLRMYTKVYILRSLAWEDYVIVLAWLFWIGETIPSELTMRYGGGVHMWDVQLHTFFRLLYYINVSAILYDFAVFFVKLSILLQYLRIFAPTRNGNMFIYIGAHLCIWSNLIFYLVDSIFTIAACIPRKKIWDPLMTSGHCFNQNAMYQATGYINIASDFAILVLPMPCIWRLHLPLKQKLLMTVVFAAGLFACVTSMLRTYYTWKFVHSPDISYNVVPMGMWDYAELSSGMIISCMPVIPKFFQHVGPKVFAIFTFKSRPINGSSNTPTSATPSAKVRTDKIKVPSLKNMFSPVTSDKETDDEHELSGQGYIVLDDEMNVAKRDAARDLIHIPAGKLATARDDLERGFGVF